MLKLPPEYRNKETLYRRLILFTLSLGLIVIYFSQIIHIIATAIWVCLPFIIGGILAFVLNTFCSVIMRLAHRFLHWSVKPKYLLLYKILTLVIIVGFVSLLMVFIIPQLVSSVEKIMRELPDYYASMMDEVLLMAKKAPVIEQWLLDHEEQLRDGPKLIGQVAEFISTGNAGNALSPITDVIQNTFSWLWTLLLSLVFMIIAFFNTSSFIKEARLVGQAYIPEKWYQSVVDFISMVSRIFSQYIGGSVLECIILATLVSVFGLIFQIPYAVLIGVFCGVFALVPMFGATTAAIISTLFLLLESPGKAITFLIMFICIQQVEGNFIYPNVVGKSVGLPPMFVVVSITIGASLAGVLGMIVSIPIASVIYELIMKQARKRMLVKEGGKNDTEAESG